MKKPSPDNIKEFRLWLLVELRDVLLDFDSYITNEYYLNDVPTELSISNEFLINKGIELLIYKCNDFGIKPTDDSFVDNFYDSSILLDIYSYIQPKNILPILNIIKEDDSNKELLLQLLDTDDTDNLLYNFFDILSNNIKSEIIIEYRNFIMDHLTSNNLFLLYLTNLFKLAKISENYIDNVTAEDINVWVKYILLLKTNIEKNNESNNNKINKFIYLNVNTWLNNLLEIDNIHLILKHINNELLDSNEIVILKEIYKRFKMGSVGYLEYYKFRDFNITDDIIKFIDYIKTVDPLIKLSNEKEE